MLASEYRGILYTQFFLLFVELFLNAFTDILCTEWRVFLVLHIVQSFCIAGAIVMIFYVFSKTEVSDAAMNNLLYEKFAMPIIIMFVYFGLTVGLYTWQVRQDDVSIHKEQPGIIALYLLLYVMQKLFAVMFYFSYKRTTLRLGDHRFYEDSDWIRYQFETRRL